MADLVVNYKESVVLWPPCVQICVGSLCTNQSMVTHKNIEAVQNMGVTTTYQAHIFMPPRVVGAAPINPTLRYIQECGHYTIIPSHGQMCLHHSDEWYKNSSDLVTSSRHS